MEWEMDSICSNAGAVPVRCGEEEAEPEGEAHDLQVHLHSNPILTSFGEDWSR